MAFPTFPMLPTFPFFASFAKMPKQETNVVQCAPAAKVNTILKELFYWTNFASKFNFAIHKETSRFYLPFDLKPISEDFIVEITLALLLMLATTMRYACIMDPCIKDTCIIDVEVETDLLVNISWVIWPKEVKVEAKRLVAFKKKFIHENEAGTGLDRAHQSQAIFPRKT